MYLSGNKVCNERMPFNSVLRYIALPGGGRGAIAFPKFTKFGQNSSFSSSDIFLAGTPMLR